VSFLVEVHHLPPCSLAFAGLLQRGMVRLLPSNGLDKLLRELQVLQSFLSYKDKELKARYPEPIFLGGNSRGGKRTRLGPAAQTWPWTCISWRGWSGACSSATSPTGATGMILGLFLLQHGRVHSRFSATPPTTAEGAIFGLFYYCEDAHDLASSPPLVISP
jgi:hypothetical protein